MNSFPSSTARTSTPRSMSTTSTANFVVLEGAGHGFGGQDAVTATREMVDWFESHLAGE